MYTKVHSHFLSFTVSNKGKRYKETKNNIYNEYSIAKMCRYEFIQILDGIFVKLLFCTIKKREQKNIYN